MGFKTQAALCENHCRIFLLDLTDSGSLLSTVLASSNAAPTASWMVLSKSLAGTDPYFSLLFCLDLSLINMYTSKGRLVKGFGLLYPSVRIQHSTSLYLQAPHELSQKNDYLRRRRTVCAAA
jgi:hypothetical protein